MKIAGRLSERKVKVKSAPIVIGRVRRLISAGAYLRFLWYEATRSIYTPPGWDTSPSEVTSQHFLRLSPSNLLVPIILYTWVERGTVRVNFFAKEHNVGALARARTMDIQVPSLTHLPLNRHVSRV